MSVKLFPEGFKNSKAAAFLKAHLSTNEKTPKEKVKPLTIRGILILVGAAILNQLSAEFLGVSIPTSVITDFLTSVF